MQQVTLTRVFLINTLSFLDEAGEICLLMGVKGQKKFQTTQKLLKKSMPVLFLEKKLITEQDTM